MKGKRSTIMTAVAVAACLASCGSAGPDPLIAADNEPRTHVLNEGPVEVGKVTVSGIDYHLVVNKIIDVDPGKPLYALYVTRGSWQVAKPQIIADPGHVLQSADDPKENPKAYMAKVVEQINAGLSRQFVPSPLPRTWEEVLEIDLQLLRLEEDGGKVVLK